MGHALRWSDEQFRAHLAARRIEQAAAPRETPPEPRYRSKLEARYAQTLDALQRSGEILEWRHEPFSLRIAGGRYTPDFLTIDRVRTIRLIEVKGYMTDASRIKLCAAVEQWPWFEWRIVGRSLTPIVLRVAVDVPSARRSVK